MQVSLTIDVASGKGSWDWQVRQKSLNRIMQLAIKSFKSYPFVLDPCECGELCCDMNEQCWPCLIQNAFGNEWTYAYLQEVFT